MASRTYCYVSNANSREIIVLQLDPENGDVGRVQQVAVSGKVMPMTVSPDRRFLYASMRSEPYSVASFAIDPLDGSLTHLADAPLPDSMTYLSTDRTGRFLFAAAIPGGGFQGMERERLPQAGVISLSAIGAYGFVHPAHQVVRTEPKMHAILPDPSNRYVFATSCDGDVVLRQIFDSATGLFSPNPLPPVRVKSRAGPRHFVFHPNNRFLYLLNETDASIYVFDYNAGALHERQIVSALPPDFGDQQPYAADLHLTPDGKFLYASERRSHTLAAFRVDLVTGTLFPVGNFPTEKQPRSFAIDPFGRYLLAIGRLSHSMTVHAINRDNGYLTSLKQYPMGQGPNWIEIVRLP